MYSSVILAARGLFRGLGLRIRLDGDEHVPVDRAAPAAAYLRARTLLRRGEAVDVFPRRA